MMEMFKKNAAVAWKFAAAFFKWLAIAVFIGCIGGTIGTAFHYLIDIVTQTRGKYPAIIFALPVVGIIIVLIYKLCGLKPETGTNQVINSVRSDEKLPAALIPAIFISTVLSHFSGASVGREGAALQLGGSVGNNIGRVFKLDKNDVRSCTLCGMAAVFSALFGTPIAATFFVIEVISVGTIYYSSLIPCVISAYTAYQIAGALGVKPTLFAVTVPETDPITVVKVVALAVLCAALSIIICVVIHGCSLLFAKYVKNLYIKALIGGVVMLIFTLIWGSQRYNGAGMNIIVEAIAGNALGCDFIIKLLLTAICIGAGFKGGEIVPTFFIGATFGCVVGPMLGLPAGFSAAAAMIAVFCGVVNCPVASLFLALEMFGSSQLLLFAIACCVSFMLSGYYGLYSSQKFDCSKLTVDFFERDTN